MQLGGTDEVHALCRGADRGAHRVCRSVPAGTGYRAARKAILIEQRDQLVQRMADMQRSLDRLNQKIANYETQLLPREQEMMSW